MSFKKLLGIISVVVIVMFALMLTTSYAWYSFENASTTFDVVTNNDDVIINYITGEYINTNIAVPIKSADIAKYAEKNNFTIRAKNNQEDNDLLVTISLVDISIDGALQNANFIVKLYHQGTNVASYGGNTIGTSGTTTKKLATVTLDDDVDNNFELRVYILDNDGDQSSMMDKTFQAKIQVDVVSRLKASFAGYVNPDIYVSSITIDGVDSDNLPTSGYYSMTSSCNMGSDLSWDPLSKTITYNSGSYVNDECTLTFTSSTDYPLLSEMPVGSYVKYDGANGCEGNSCSGQNANYVSDTNMGYCYNSDNKFTVNGWRIGYVEDDSAYLISAGATDCMCTNSDGTTSSSSCSSYLTAEEIEKHLDNLDVAALKYCNKNYAYGGACNGSTAWAMDAVDFEKITGSSLSSSSCYGSYSDTSCGYTNDLIDNGGYYWFATVYDFTSYDVFNWYPANGRVNSHNSSYLRGVRPVLYLDSSVMVTGGAGTYDDPYIIKN